MRKEEPRTGKRKPIEESEDEEEAKKVQHLSLTTLLERKPFGTIIGGW